MKYLRYLAILGVMTMLPLTYSQAQVRFGVGVGVGPGYVAGPPVCAYGYYPYYPYACAPYGYYGPSYFVGGVFIGAGPWYHWGHPAEFWNRGVYGRAGWGWAGRPGYVARGTYDRGYANGFARGEVLADNQFHGGAVRSGGGFHGGFRR